MLKIDQKQNNIFYFLCFLPILCPKIHKGWHVSGCNHRKRQSHSLSTCISISGSGGTCHKSNVSIGSNLDIWDTWHVDVDSFCVITRVRLPTMRNWHNHALKMWISWKYFRLEDDVQTRFEIESNNLLSLVLTLICQ